MTDFLLKKRPNIVLIMCDQMRGDCLGIAGHPDVKTPYLDSLAAEGTYFPNAYSACPSCIPARAALFTGLSQEHHHRVGYQDGITWDYPHMLPAALSDGGYHTEMVGKMHVHPPLYRCDFQNMTLHDGYIGYYRNPNAPAKEHQLFHDSYLHWLKCRCGYDADVNDAGLECNSFLVKPWPYDEMSHPTNWTVSESIRFLEQRDRSQPFFLMTSFVRPHPPLDAPKDYLDFYMQMDLHEPAMGDWAHFEKERVQAGRMYDSPYGTDDPTLRRTAMAGYYACITHMDHQIGRLIQALYRERILEDTIILFTSDHGELLFDHGLFRKVQPFQGSIRIPFLIRVGKNLIDYPQTAICDDLVELRDILPTILSATRIPLTFPTDGFDLIPALYGKPHQQRDFLHGEHSGGNLSNQYIVTKEDKYIWYSQTGKELYFDLKSDKIEVNNRMEDPSVSQRIKYLRNLLITQLTGREEGYSDGQNLVIGCKPVTMLSSSHSPDRGNV